MTKFSYLQRLKQRKHLAQLQEQIVFGLTLGWSMTLVGGFHYFFAIDSHDNFWKALLYIKIGLIAISVILPSAISLFQSLQRFRLLCNTVFLLPLSYHSFQL